MKRPSFMDTVCMLVGDVSLPLHAPEVFFE